MKEFFDRLQKETAAGWARVHAGPFWRHLTSNGLDRDLYIAVMTEIYHYTRYNSQNQALAAVRLTSERLPLLRYCLNHALEEAGHDLMALTDLESIGVAPETTLNRRPLPETQALISYLFRVATEHDATARLGYSFWAEDAYGYIEELLAAMRRDLDLTDRHMTFFVAHAEIDADHAEEVKKIITKTCTRPELQEDLVSVLKTSLHLTGNILNAAYAAYAESR
jgi:pyrroloquinoline quinone (PQQ) biosynthesis protein C